VVKDENTLRFFGHPLPSKKQKAGSCKLQASFRHSAHDRTLSVAVFRLGACSFLPLLPTKKVASRPPSSILSANLLLDQFHLSPFLTLDQFNEVHAHFVTGTQLDGLSGREAFLHFDGPS
jgi:hypothetical protein